jgi:Peptidase A4 family
MRTAHIIPALAAAVAVVTCMAPSASAATTDTQEATSANWSGYVADGSVAGSSQQFSSVSASWVEPTVNCSSGDGDAAFWVGLGGAGQGNGSLEQVGTQANCSNGASGNHYAWYELVPAAPVKLGVGISPGDHVAAKVSASTTAVTVTLTNNTTGASTTKTLQMQNPDLSSAEWIAEAPSACDQSGDCTPLSLANFGSVDFSNASATANGHTGTISDPNWNSQPVQLNGNGQTVDPGSGFASDGASASAAPSSLPADGSSFSVSWQSARAQPATSSSTDPGTSGYSDPGGSSGYAPGSDYGWGGGYAGGDGYGGGYGDGGGGWGAYYSY